MASATQPRRRQDSLGPNPFRLRPRVPLEVAQQITAPDLPTPRQPTPRRPAPRRSLLDPLQPKDSSSTRAECHLSHRARSETSEPSTLHPTAHRDTSSSTPQSLLPVIQPSAIQADQDDLHGHFTPGFHDVPNIPSVSPSLSSDLSPIPGDIDIAMPPHTRLAGSLFPPHPQPRLWSVGNSRGGEDANSDPAARYYGNFYSFFRQPSFSWFSQSKPAEDQALRDADNAEREVHQTATKERQPFLLSPLGRVPAEIREMIYTYALTLPTSQSPIVVRKSSEDNNIGSKEVSTVISAASINSSSGTDHKVSHLAILQTCRVIHCEAQDIYYASNAFHTRSAEDLRIFLLGIGLARCELLTTLHIEGLLVRAPMFTNDWLDDELEEGRMTQATYEDFAKLTRWKLSAVGKAVSRLVAECKRLQKVHLLMGTSDECNNIMGHIEFARRLAGERWSNEVIILDGSHWLVRPMSSQGDWYGDVLETVYDETARMTMFPQPAEGQQRCVEVDIKRDLKVEKM